MNWYKLAQQSIRVDESEILRILNTPTFDASVLSHYLYDRITTNVEGSKIHNEKSEGEKFKKTEQMYDSIMKTFNHRNNWSFIWVEDGFPNDENIYYKLYYTPLHTDCLKLAQNFAQLANFLKPISKSYQSDIDYKSPQNLWNYLRHNDRLVIHFTKQEAVQEIQQAVSSWASMAGISFGNRNYTIGQDAGGRSWGQRISDNLATAAYQYLQSKKWTIQQIAQWVLQQATTALRDFQIKQKEFNVMDVW